MLHAFDDATGEELWAFIPPVLLPSLKGLTGESLAFFVDGSPKVYRTESTTVLLFGLRRGGNQYIALDVSDPLSPKYLWDISPSRTGFGELGQTWSTPQLGKIVIGSQEKWVFFIGGGYDENQDNEPVSANDSKGRAVYVIDALTGDLVWSYTYAKNNLMRYSIPSDITRVDTDGNGRIDRLYVGDMGGRMWRFDIGDPDTSKWTGKIIFNSSSGGVQRKIFYPPDVTLEKDSGNYEMLFFGTGDREHPKAFGLLDRLYGLKDKNPSSPLGEGDLVDVTEDLLQNPATSSAQKTSILESLRAGNGWYIKLNENPGEKCLSNPVVFFGTVYYTTFTPDPGSESDICFVGEGTARIYALNFKTGNAVFNLDGVGTINNLTRSDRNLVIGTVIPSGTIITFIGGTAVGYVGVGGGVYTPKLATTKSLFPVNWRIVY